MSLRGLNQPEGGWAFLGLLGGYFLQLAIVEWTDHNLSTHIVLRINIIFNVYTYPKHE